MQEKDTDSAPLGSGSRQDAVQRVRSRHHRHRHGAAFRVESEAEARHAQDMKIIFRAFPWSVLVVGLILRFFATRQRDPALRPQGLVSLSWEIIAFGVALVAVSYAFSAWRASSRRRDESRSSRSGRHSGSSRGSGRS